ncbi:hypothetical protein [Ureibacillus chungkukjangi]|nr:hypothetical protein [Ureibacillus chungkukjangi]
MSNRGHHGYYRGGGGNPTIGYIAFGILAFCVIAVTGVFRK